MAYLTDELDKNRREVRFRREIALSERVSIANESKFLLRSTASSATGSYRKSVFVEPQLIAPFFFSTELNCNAFVLMSVCPASWLLCVEKCAKLNKITKIDLRGL